MYSIAKKLLFSLNPEVAHELSLDWLGAAERLHLLQPFVKKMVSAPVEVMGIRFPNAVGLAAGMDKDGEYFNAFGHLGFGFIEVGTVTPLAQPGNPKPRLFRLVEQEAVINRMGFNNKGVQNLVSKVKKRRYNGVLGINIGKNKLTPEENALSDYEKCMDAVYECADYITINISSPNTPGLRNLQFGENLEKLLKGIKAKQAELMAKTGKKTPIAVKIAPDMTDDELKAVADQLLANNYEAVVATNTTISRDGLESSEYKNEAGGLSGRPVKDKSTHAIKVLADHLQGAIPIIGVGGIMSSEDAVEKIEAGASLVQLYTGFIYQGPELVAEAASAIAALTAS
ncbi:quinone-dependent dihydroorotate dehydrogenase [Teredinibacter haidensis]|uniref:quinone-dependent dihydroorotate dehydrogenase n=1 Tax=Teredinibacter haidensis TaxID=2731755 RepID=UPI0009491B84|nr:quinone-dependent dihydroorotate dehydrogenase [Teredinibacter haidensis]